MLPVFTHPWVDGTHAPIFVIKAPERLTDADLDEFIAAFGRFYATVGQSFVNILDARGLQEMSADQRKKVVELDRQYQPLDRIYCRGQAVVLTSALQRGILRAWHWMLPPVYPAETFTTLEPAFRWAQRQLADDPSPRTKRQLSAR